MQEIIALKEKIEKYVNRDIPPDLTDRQREAVAKMIFLEECDLFDLVQDIAHEIDIRETRIKFVPKSSINPKRNESRKKINLLDDNMFIDLCIDVLLVIKNRYKTSEIDAFSEFANDIETMIDELKKDFEDDELVKKEIESTDNIWRQIQIFMEYTKNVFEQKGIGKGATDAICNAIEKHFQCDLEKNIKNYLSPKFFVIAAEHILSENPEFLYHKEQIEKIETSKLSFRKGAVSNEMIAIFSLLLKNIKDEPSSVDIRYEISVLMERLEKFVRGLKKQDASLGFEFLEAASGLKERLKDVKIDHSLLQAYERQFLNVKIHLKESTVTQELLNSVIEFTFFVKELFSTLNVDLSENTMF